MFSYEKQLDKRAEPETFTVPTALMRTGNFSELLPLGTQIYDPATAFLGTMTATNPGNGCPSGVVCRTAFAGNIIPQNRLNPAAVKFLNLYPLPNVPGVSNGTIDNYFSNQVLERPYDSYLTRIDHNFNESHRIFGKFFYSKSNEDRLNWINEPNSVTQGFEIRQNKGGNVDYTATLSNNMLLDIRSSLNDFVQERTQANPISAADLGFSGIAAITTSPVFPRFDFSANSYDTLGAERADFNEGLTRNFRLFSLQPTLTQIYGNHTLKYGYDYRKLMENRITNGNNAGQFTFSGAFTAQASNSNATATGAVGRDLAAFLLGLPSSGTIQTTPAEYDVTSNYHAAFIQDDWRISPKLTLNLGLRYELESGVREAEGRFVTGFDTAAESPFRAGIAANIAQFGAPAGVPLTTLQNLAGGLQFAQSSNDPNQATDKNNFQPRFGISYALNDKTVLRGGFGIFTAPFQIQPIFQPGFVASTGFNPTANNGLTFLANVNNPFPTGLTPVTGSSLGLRTATGTTLGTTNATGPTEAVVYSYDRKNANYARFIVGIQRELPFNIGVEATFVLSRGKDLPVLRQLNYIPRQYLIDVSGLTAAATINAQITANNTFLNQTVANPFRGLIPGGGTFNNATIQRRLLLTQFPQFQDLIVTEYNGSNDYRSLQLQANKRLSSGFSFNASYTYTHEREKTRRLNPQDEELTDMLSTFSRPHRITFSGIAELPFGRNRQFFSNWHPVVDAVLGGWQFNAVYEWQSGEPLLLQNNFFNGDPSQLRNRLGQTDEQGRKYGVDIPGWDTSLFRTTDTNAFIAFGNNYTVGSQNVLRTLPMTLNNFRMQPFQKFDVGLTKNFQIREGMKLQVRVEAINALNRVYYNVPQLASNNAAFGLSGGQRNLPRDIQLGARFTF